MTTTGQQWSQTKYKKGGLWAAFRLPRLSLYYGGCLLDYSVVALRIVGSALCHVSTAVHWGGQARVLLFFLAIRPPFWIWKTLTVPEGIWFDSVQQGQKASGPIKLKEMRSPVFNIEQTAPSIPRRSAMAAARWCNFGTTGLCWDRKAFISSEAAVCAHRHFNNSRLHRRQEINLPQTERQLSTIRSPTDRPSENLCFFCWIDFRKVSWPSSSV